MANTQHLNLTLPVTAQPGWGDVMNSNLIALDSAHGAVAAFNTLQAFENASGVLTVDLSLGRVIHVDLAGTVTGVTLESLTDGVFTFHVVQPAGGNCGFAFPAICKGAGEVSVAAGTATASTISMQSFAYNSKLGYAYPVGPLITVSK